MNTIFGTMNQFYVLLIAYCKEMWLPDSSRQCFPPQHQFILILIRICNIFQNVNRPKLESKPKRNEKSSDVIIQLNLSYMEVRWDKMPACRHVIGVQINLDYYTIIKTQGL